MGPVLVTGATGFLGGAVARGLKSRGIEVRATGRNRAAGERFVAEGIPFFPCDLADGGDAVTDLTRGCDAVVHAAGLSAPWGRPADFLAANVVATRNVIAACRDWNVRRLVHISSPSVLFALRHQHDLSEAHPWTEAPVNDYIATKREAERLAIEAGAIALRPRALFGPGDTTLIPRVLRVARRGPFPLFGDDDPLIDLTWIGDAVAAVILAWQAAGRCDGRVYHITSGDAVPRSAILRAVLEGNGLEARYRRIPVDRALAIAALLEWVSRWATGNRWEPPLTRYGVGVLAYAQTLDISAARRDLGYEPGASVIDLLKNGGREGRRA